MSTRGYPAFNTEGKRIHSREQLVKDPGLNMMLDAQKMNNQAFLEQLWIRCFIPLTSQMKNSIKSI